MLTTARLATWALEGLGADNSYAKWRRFDGDPAAFAVDVFGLVATPQLEEMCAEFERHDRVLLPSANNVGKSAGAAALAAYWIIVVGTRAAPGGGITGSRCLLTGPSYGNVRTNLYGEILDGLARAKNRGWPIPGEWSEASIRWQVGASDRHKLEAFTPRIATGQAVAHGASGAHHEYLLVIAEEVAGVAPPVWNAIEGMCSGEGNKVFGLLNPTEPAGPAYDRAQRSRWRVKHLSAMDFPNVRRRASIVPGAVSAGNIDARVRDECVPLRRWTEGTDLKPDEMVYALPPEDLTIQAPHPLVPGHAEGEPWIYRCSPLFVAQVLGQWPEGETAGRLCSPLAWQEAVDRWEVSIATVQGRRPSGVAVDLALTGDTILATPWWGAQPGVELMRTYREALREGDVRAAAELRESNRIVVGVPVEIRGGDTHEVAARIDELYHGIAMAVDRGGVGRGIYDVLLHDYHADVVGVDFGGKPARKITGEPDLANMRAQMYYRSGWLVERGLVDLPRPMGSGTRAGLREQFFAHRLEGSHVTEKDKVKKEIGRSPDDADSLVQALAGGVRAAVLTARV